MKVMAVIPCHNEKEHIVPIVRTLQDMAVQSIVVDDGSSDGTVFEVANLTSVIRQNGSKLGAGGATRLGVNMALQLGADIVLTIDGDGQHNPMDAPRLLKPIQEGVADVVVGSRFIMPQDAALVPQYRRFGIRTITGVYNFGSTEKLSDAQCCFRAFSRRAAKLNITESDFAFSTEMLVKARANRMRIVEVPLACFYDEDVRQNSTINPIKHGLGVALKTLRWRLWELFNKRKEQQS